LNSGRRHFLGRTLSVIGTALFGGSVLAGCETDLVKSSNTAVQLDLASAPELAAVGATVKRTFASVNGGQPVLIRRLDAEEFLVLSTVCTHEACEVNLPGARGITDISCDCHGSQYDPATGTVTQGPAPAPLARFQADFDDTNNLLTITF